MLTRAEVESSPYHAGDNLRKKIGDQIRMKPLATDTSALEKARRAARTPQRNPMSNADATRAFLRLITQDGVASLDVAQDIALENELKIDDISENTAKLNLYPNRQRGAGSQDGMFVLDSHGSIEVIWQIRAGYVPPTGTMKPYLGVHLDIGMDDDRREVFIGNYTNPKVARRIAASYAWMTCRIIKEALAARASGSAVSLDMIYRQVMSRAGLSSAQSSTQWPTTMEVPREIANPSPRPNPPKAQAEEQFLELLRDPHPRSLDVAQDLALAHSLHIDEISERSFETREPLPVHIAPSIGSPSTVLGDDREGVDYDVTLTFGSKEVECEVTLVPNERGRLVKWGDVSNWISQPAIDVIDSLNLGRTAESDLYNLIVEACRVGESKEMDVSPMFGMSGMESGIFILDDLTSVTWHITNPSGNDATGYGVQIDTMFDGLRRFNVIGHFDRTTATLTAIRYAWGIAKLLRSSLATNASHPNNKTTIKQIDYMIRHGFDKPVHVDLVSVKALCSKCGEPRHPGERCE